MSNVGSWLVKGLLFVAAAGIGVAVSVAILASEPNVFFVILAVWILSIVLAGRNTPRVDSPSRVAYNFWRLVIVATSAALLYLVLFPWFVRPRSTARPVADPSVVVFNHVIGFAACSGTPAGCVGMVAHDPRSATWG